MMEVFFCLVKVSKTLFWLMLAVSLILNSLTIVVAFKITSYLAAGFHVSRAAMFWLSSFNPVFCVYTDWPIVSHIVSFRNYESITCYLHNIKINREKVLFKLKSNIPEHIIVMLLVMLHITHSIWLIFAKSVEQFHIS